MWNRIVVFGTWWVCTLACPMVTACGVEDPFQKDPSKAFPVLEGWSVQGKPLCFTADNLYKFINGEADSYLPYRLEYALFADYVQAKETSRILNAEVFKLGSALDAFGVYAHYKPKTGTVVDTGCEGSLGVTQLVFYKGCYFVRVTVSDKSDASATAMISCGRNMAGAIPGDSQAPLELRALRIDEVVPGTEQYVAKDLLGLPILRNGLTAEARVGGKTARVFVACGDTRDDAASRLSTFETRVVSQQGSIRWEEFEGKKVGMTRLEDLKGILISQEGRFLAGLCLLEDSEEGLPVIAKLMKNISAHLLENHPE